MIPETLSLETCVSRVITRVHCRNHMREGFSNLVKEPDKKGFIDRIRDGISKKWKNLFGNQLPDVNINSLTHRIPPDIVETFRKIQSVSDITSSNEYRIEGNGLAGSGGVCFRVIYQMKYIFIIKKINTVLFSDSSWVKLEREITLHSSLR